MSYSSQAVIIGGGIGGLATAIALRKVGIEARVFERAPELAHVGAGLSLWPNGLRALDALGLGEDVRSRSFRDLNSGLRRWDGRVLVAANGEALERRLGDVSVVVHRAELTQLLRRELPDDAVVTHASCIGFREDESGVTARFANGSRAHGELLVGADGIHSVVRAGLFGAPPPSYAGYTAWRGVVGFDHARLVPGVSIGHGCQFGQAPMANGEVYWFATENGPGERRAPSGGWKAHLLELFARWHPPIVELLAATPESAILHNDILDRPPLELWSKGRVTLLGDAAHPMTPNLGQGANQALEDACALGRALSRYTHIRKALDHYESARRERANAVVLGSRRVGQVMQLEHPAACWLRDTLLGTRVATQLQLRQLTRLVSAQAA
jgi:2-polyprenyl-6-methoxyphenol hydroxylase-like FAD-dependent oxidoreductase